MEKWIDQSSVVDIVPTLIKLVPMQTYRRQSVTQAIQEGCWVRNHMTISPSNCGVSAPLGHNTFSLSSGDTKDDVIIWKWTGEHNVLGKVRVLNFHHGAKSFHDYKLIWKTRAPLKVKIFL